MNKLILYLIKRKLGLKNYEFFKFTNQNEDAVYYFNDKGLIKAARYGTYKSGVSLNWLLDPNCKIEKVKK